MGSIKEQNKTDPVIVIDDCWNRIGVWGKQKPKCAELEKVVHCINCKVYSGAGRRLLDRASDPEYIASWSQQLKGKKDDRHKNDIPVVVFRIASEWLALSVRLLHEVVEMRVVHRVPHAKSGILRGLVNIRGELQLCISLGQLMGIERRSRAKDAVQGIIGQRMVVMDNGEDRYVFPVSEVQGIHRYALHDLQAVPATAGQSATNYLSGVLELSERHVGYLNEKTLFSALKRIL